MLNLIKKPTLALITLSSLISAYACKSPQKSDQPVDQHPKTQISLLTDYLIFKTDMGNIATQQISLADLSTQLLGYDVIFIGETHGHIGNHIAQAEIFAALHERHNATALSLEQFERHEQDVLNSYLSGEIGEQTLIFETDAWDGYAQSYRPLVEYAKDKALPVIAANMPTDIVRCIGERGPDFLTRLSAPEQNWAAQTLDLSGGAYKEKFYSFLKDGGAAHGVAADNQEQEDAYTYAAQIGRDQTMADSITQHMEENPSSKIVHMNGHFHSAQLLGTPERVQASMPALKIANIHPVLLDSSNPIDITPAQARQGHYILALKDTPRRFVQMSNINAYIARMLDETDEKKCPY